LEIEGHIEVSKGEIIAMRDKSNRAVQVRDFSRDLYLDRKEEEKRCQIGLKKEIQAVEGELMNK